MYYRLVLLVLVMMAQPNNLYAEMYKWIDQNGIVRYSNVAPPSSSQQVETTKEINEGKMDGATRITNEQIENAKNNISNRRTFPIDLSGTIVDSQGSPVSNVKMTVKEIRSIPGTSKEKRTKRNRTVDGAFEVQCQDCSDIKLRFLADGFYPKQVSFQLTEAEIESYMFGRDGDGFRFVRQGVVVQLEESSNPVILGRVAATLDFYREDVGRVLTLKAGKPQISSKREVLKKRTLSGNYGPSMISLEAPIIMLDEIVRILKNYPPNSTSPIDIYLDFSGPQTGVIPVEVSKPTGSPRKAYRELKEAPEDGYSNRLAINPDPKENKGQYFYCRFGGLFGKGQVSSLRSGYDRNSDRTLEVGIEIYFNRGGSRNLDSLDY